MTFDEVRRAHDEHLDRMLRMVIAETQRRLDEWHAANPKRHLRLIDSMGSICLWVYTEGFEPSALEDLDRAYSGRAAFRNQFGPLTALMAEFVEVTSELNMSVGELRAGSNDVIYEGEGRRA